MKSFLLVCTLIFTSIYYNASAQNFFPLKVGNVYQIKDVSSWSGPGGTGGSETEFSTISVPGDTLINGETFFQLSGAPFTEGCWFRYDSLNQKLLVKIPADDSIRLAIDFNAPANSTYTSYLMGEAVVYTSEGITPEVYWGDTLQTYTMTSLTGTYDIFNFTEDIGFTYLSSCGGGGSFWYCDEYTTVSAILDSNIIHPIILGIDSLYPVIDRPINTFPYLLSIPYYKTYYQLINNFKLFLEVERDSEIVYNLTSNISLSNPVIQINPPNLEPGDVIRLRAVLSDTSIFNNMDTYPDSGWITFRVLDPVSVRDDNSLSFNYKLEQNYPNPFNPSTVITYEIPKRTFVSIKVYDILGRESADLVDKEMTAGRYEVEFNGEKLSSGIYICRFKAEGFSKSTKMILTK